MPRRHIASHMKRDKLANKIDPYTRAEAQLADFLAQQAKEGDPSITRGALIEEILLNYAKHHGFSDSNATSSSREGKRLLASFVRKKLSAFLATRATRDHVVLSDLVETILTNWAKRNGYKPRD